MVCFVSVSSDPGSMPGGGARGQNLGHLKMCYLHSVFSSLSSYLNKYL